MRLGALRSTRLLVALAILCCVTVFAWKLAAPGRVQRRLAAARNALTAEQFVEAADLAAQVLRESPDNAGALLVQAGSAAAIGRDDLLDQSLRRLQQLPDRNRPRDLLQGGNLFLGQGRLGAAERYFRRLNELEPRNAGVHGRLSLLLEMEGRRWEARSHLFELVREGSAALEILVFLGNRSLAYDLSDQLEQARRVAPKDPGPWIGLAQLALHRGEEESAEHLLRAALSADPSAIEAHAILGNLLAGRLREFLDWYRTLPADADGHPDVWQARGAFAARAGDVRSAARCYWEAARRDSDHRVAHHELARLLEHLGQTAATGAIRKRAENLAVLEVKLSESLVRQRDTALFLEIARGCETLGRVWEAWAWYGVILAIEPESRTAPAEMKRLAAILSPQLPRVLPSAAVAGSIDLSDFPIPQWSPIDAPLPATRRDDSQICFVDEAAQAGLQFRYYNSSRPAGTGWRLHETNGGGVAAFDFDLDGWPDIYFAQGCDWPPVSGRRDHSDVLFHNLGGRRFADVTAAAGLGDESFGQGVAAGDFNDDGWPDLLVGNFGQNCLYRNNGDCTFTDVAAQSGIAGPGWTTSCLIADLNGDSWPDLYEVRYVAGDEATRRQCTFGGALPRACPPYVFAPEDDRLWLSRGDGSFVDASTTAGITAPDGFGLGVVAADLELSGRLGVFVANDGTPNFWFVNQEHVRGGMPQFVDHARLAGLAVAGDGLPRAGMAAVVEDVDGDGRLDVFVTNFYREGNRLYRQQEGGLFTDAGRDAGLIAPSFLKLGFGAQFIDCDLDGWPDLFVANGHVDDFQHQGIPFRMSPQLLRNDGRGRFSALAPPRLGSYFEHEYLGRAVARLDWNGDGREDLVVTHLDSPAALLTNATPDAGNFIAVELKGTNSSRDAIGATVRCTSETRTRLRQLTAGDGYLSANQKLLIFGVGISDEPVSLEVIWPSGQRQDYDRLPVNRRVLLIEGRSAAISIDPF